MSVSRESALFSNLKSGSPGDRRHLGARHARPVEVPRNHRTHAHYRRRLRHGARHRRCARGPWWRYSRRCATEGVLRRRSRMAAGDGRTEDVCPRQWRARNLLGIPWRPYSSRWRTGRRCGPRTVSRIHRGLWPHILLPGMFLLPGAFGSWTTVTPIDQGQGREFAANTKRLQ